MDRTCKTVKGQVNAINYFLTVMAEQESSTYPHSPSLCTVMGLNDSFMWAFAAVGPPMTFRKGQKIRPFEKGKKKITFYACVLFTLQLKQKCCRVLKPLLVHSATHWLDVSNMTGMVKFDHLGAESPRKNPLIHHLWEMANTLSYLML